MASERGVLLCVPRLFCPGGVERLSLSIVEAVASQPNQMATVLSLEDAPSLPAFCRPGLSFQGCRSRPRWWEKLRFSFAFLRAVVRRPRLVFFSHLLLAPLGWVFCRPLGIPYWVLLHGLDGFKPLRGLWRSVLFGAQKVAATSDYNADLFSGVQGLDRARFVVMPCSVNGDLFRPGPKPQHLVTRFGLGDGPVLLTVSRLHPLQLFKGVDTVLRALPEMLREFPSTKYLIVGEGGRRASLEALTHELGLDAHVIFTGEVDARSLLDYYHVADAFVLPSKEGFGISYLEALACGVPVVSGNADGSVAPLQGGKVGWRVPPQDPAAVAKACLEILRKQDPRTQGAWLREQTLAVFSEKTVRAQIARLLC